MYPTIHGSPGEFARNPSGNRFASIQPGSGGDPWLVTGRRIAAVKDAGRQDEFAADQPGEHDRARPTPIRLPQRAYEEMSYPDCDD
jgi:hypothetical protein